MIFNFFFVVLGNGVYGEQFDFTFTAWHLKSESPGCHGFGGLSCGPEYHHSNGGLNPANAQPAVCYGTSGTDGTSGKDWPS